MKWLFWSLSGLCLALISIHQVFWWLFLPGILLFLRTVTRSSGYREVVMGGLLVGLIKCLGGYSFVWAIYPMTWVALGNISQIIFIGLYWVSTSVFMGSGVAVAAVSLFYLWTNYQRLFLWFFPVAWLVGEVVGSLMASVILLGYGSYLNINIGHGYLGMALSNISLFYPFASLGGLYGLTFIAATIGSFSYYILSREKWSLSKKIFWSGYALVALCVLYMVYPIASVPAMNQRIVAIDTKFTGSLLKEPNSDRLKATSEVGAVLAAAKTAPDIILLPEDSRLTSYLGGEEKTRMFLNEHIEGEPLVVDSMRVEEGGGAVLRAVYYDLKNNVVYMTDKQFLTPQGEYISYPFVWLMRLIGQGDQMDKILSNQNYVPGKMDNYHSFPADIPGFMFCFESSSVYGLSRLVELRESPVVLHSVSHSRFNDPRILWFQLDSMIRAQVIYTNKIVISANNMAHSKIYTPDGNVSSGSKILETEFFDLIEYNI